jgi:hypothetical protein
MHNEPHTRVFIAASFVIRNIFGWCEGGILLLRRE